MDSDGSRKLERPVTGGGRARDGDRSRSEATTSTRDARVQRTRGDGPEQALLARALERRRAVDEARDDVLVRLRGDARAVVASAASAARGARRGARGAGRAPRASRGPCPSCAGARRTGSATARGEAAAVGARRFRGDCARAAARRGPVRDDRRRDELVRRGAALVGDLRRPARAGARGRRRDASGARARRRFREGVRGRRATGRLPQWKDATRRASRDLRGMDMAPKPSGAVAAPRADRCLRDRPSSSADASSFHSVPAGAKDVSVQSLARARARQTPPPPPEHARAGSSRRRAVAEHGRREHVRRRVEHACAPGMTGLARARRRDGGPRPAGRARGTARGAGRENSNFKLAGARRGSRAA